MLRFLGALVMLAGIGSIAFGAVHWRDASVVSMLRTNGTDAIARVERGRRTNWKGAAVYAVDLSWTDTGGRKRQAKTVPITAAYAKEVVSGDRFIALTVPIKYDAKQTELAPVIVPDAERLEKALVRSGDFWFWLGAAIALVGGIVVFLAARLARES